MSENKITLAKWSHRFVAWIIDVIIISVIIHIVSFTLFGTSVLLIGQDVDSFNFDSQFFYFVGFGLMENIAYLFYWAILEHRTGQSIGKKILNIRTTTLLGEQPSFRDSIVQSFGKSFLVPIDVIGGWIFTNKNRQRLFNKLSDTIIVKITNSIETNEIDYHKD